MATATLQPDGDGTATGVIGGVPSVPPYYAVVDEGTDTPNDNDFLLISSTPGSVFFTLTDTPVDCSTVTAVSIKVRCANASKGRTIASCRIFQSDETTALTDLATITASTTITTYTLSPAISGATSKTAWDGARIVVNSGGSRGSASLITVQVDITYSTGGGGGSGGQNRIFSWLFPGKAMANLNGSLIVPHNFPT